VKRSASLAFSLATSQLATAFSVKRKTKTDRIRGPPFPFLSSAGARSTALNAGARPCYKKKARTGIPPGLFFEHMRHRACLDKFVIASSVLPTPRIPLIGCRHPKSAQRGNFSDHDLVSSVKNFQFRAKFSHKAIDCDLRPVFHRPVWIP